VLELGEDAQHLQHHPPRRRAGVERLGRRLEHDLEPVELLGEPGELAHLAGEAVDAVDEQQVEAPLARQFERLFEAGPVEADAARLVLERVDDSPVLHRFAVALQSLALGCERGGLVVLVGRDPRVQADPHHHNPPWSSGSSMRPAVPDDGKSSSKGR
jgi:hypothetical protein